MRCPRCRNEVEKVWEYCPRCGFRLKDFDFFRFDDIFQRMQKQMEEMSKMFERDFEVFDLSPVFREKPVSRRVKGFRITISSGTGREPRVSVKTFGDVKEDELKREILEQLGVEGGIERVKPEKPEEKKRLRIPQLIKPRGEAKEIPTPRITEEPKTDVRRMDSKVVVDIEIPGVKSQENIDVRELESSVEVKALAGDRAYFKILTKPSQFRLTSKKFDKGKLHLEFS